MCKTGIGKNIETLIKYSDRTISGSVKDGKACDSQKCPMLR